MGSDAQELVINSNSEKNERGEKKEKNFLLFSLKIVTLKARKYPAKSEGCKKHARLHACHPAL